MKYHLMLSLTCVLWTLTFRAFAQPSSGWEDKVSISIPSQTYITAATSDSYGQHILIRKSTTFNHYLIANDGAIIYSNTISPEVPLNTEFSATITSGNGVQTVVAGDGNALKLWRSSNGGGTWSSPVTRTIGTGVYNIDAIATSYDDNVYMVWDDNASPNPKVYFYRYHPTLGWQDFQEVTDIGGRGVIPKIMITSNKIIVSFTDPTAPDENKKGKSRDKLIGGNWETFYRTTSVMSSIDWVEYSNIAVLNNKVHMVVQPRISAFSDRLLRVTQRDVQENWLPPSTINSYYSNTGDEVNNFRRKIGVSNGSLYTFVIHGTGSGGNLWLFDYTSPGGWNATPFSVGSWPSTDPAFERAMISSSRTGMYVYWSQNIGSSPTTTSMRRKVSTLSGSIAEHMFWTGNNWLSDNTSIESGYIVILKSGSATTFLNNVQLTVKSGATLVVEPNVQLVMQGGSNIVVENGATVQVQQNANFTIPSGGILQANAGAQFRFGSSSRLLSYGQVSANGSQGAPVSFASINGSSGTWSGIVLSGSGANNSMLQHAIIQHVQTYGGAALSVVGATGVSIMHCNISGNVNYSTSGIGVTDAGAPTIAYNIINNNGRYGIVLQNTNGYIFGNTLQGNATGGVLCNAYASPGFGRWDYTAYYGNNDIQGGAYGIYAQGYSYPYVGSQYSTSYGYNSIINNTSARVYASTSEVMAEQNWWGHKSPDPNWFQETNGGFIEWEHALESDPFSVNEAPGVFPPSVSNSMGDDPGRTRGLLYQALDSRFARDSMEASRQLKSLFLNNPTSNQARAILVGLLSVYREFNDNSIYDFVRQAWQQRGDHDATMNLVMSAVLARRGDIDEAESLLNNVIARFPSSKKAALLQKFYLLYPHAPSHNLLPAIVEDLRTTYPDDPDAAYALWLYGALTSAAQVPVHRASMHSVATLTAESQIALANYPNPFNPSTTIRYSLPSAGMVSLRVLDMLGREVALVESGYKSAGRYEAVFDASRLASGIYVYRLTAGNTTLSRKMVVAK